MQTFVSLLVERNRTFFEYTYVQSRVADKNSKNLLLKERQTSKPTLIFEQT